MQPRTQMLCLYLSIRWVYVHLLEKSVFPQVLHIVPVPDNTIFHGIIYLQHLPTLRCFLPDHEVLK